ncbi:MAG: two-component system response regulator [Caulobacteraceae bacterium]|nr:two-component system response regulator [Caulobacteraceae bacterium]
MASLDKLRVLVADDNHNMRAIVVAVLKGIGIKEIREAHDGGAALSVLNEWPADLAIVDVRMDPIDGVEFTRLVRNAVDSRNRYLPIIMLTGYADRARVMEARDAGVTEIVVKPMTAKALMGRLHAVIFQPRPYVRTGLYFGPDRRRQQSPTYDGPERRTEDIGRKNSA